MEEYDRNVPVYVPLIAVNTEADDEPFFDPVWILQPKRNSPALAHVYLNEGEGGGGGGGAVKQNRSVMRRRLSFQRSSTPR